MLTKKIKCFNNHIDDKNFIKEMILKFEPLLTHYLCTHDNNYSFTTHTPKGELQEVLHKFTNCYYFISELDSEIVTSFIILDNCGFRSYDMNIQMIAGDEKEFTDLIKK